MPKFGVTFALILIASIFALTPSEARAKSIGQAAASALGGHAQSCNSHAVGANANTPSQLDIGDGTFDVLYDRHPAGVSTVTLTNFTVRPGGQPNPASVFVVSAAGDANGSVFPLGPLLRVAGSDQTFEALPIEHLSSMPDHIEVHRSIDEKAGARFTVRRARRDDARRILMKRSRAKRVRRTPVRRTHR